LRSNQGSLLPSALADGLMTKKYGFSLTALLAEAGGDSDCTPLAEANGNKDKKQGLFGTPLCFWHAYSCTLNLLICTRMSFML
jgi:hypothetical protein